MIKIRNKSQVNSKSLLGNKSKWRAAESGSVRFENAIKVERRGRKAPEVAQVTVAVEKNMPYLLTVSAVDIVGKVQLAITDKVILTISEPGSNSVKFTATSEEQTVSIRCVARTDARAKIATFKIEPVVTN